MHAKGEAQRLPESEGNWQVQHETALEFAEDFLFACPTLCALGGAAGHFSPQEVSDALDAAKDDASHGQRRFVSPSGSFKAPHSGETGVGAAPNVYLHHRQPERQTLASQRAKRQDSCCPVLSLTS